jgi:hypothetical protein
MAHEIEKISETPAVTRVLILAGVEPFTAGAPKSLARLPEQQTGIDLHHVQRADSEAHLRV